MLDTFPFILAIRQGGQLFSRQDVMHLDNNGLQPLLHVADGILPGGSWSQGICIDDYDWPANRVHTIMEDQALVLWRLIRMDLLRTDLHIAVPFQPYRALSGMQCLHLTVGGISGSMQNLVCKLAAGSLDWRSWVKRLRAAVFKTSGLLRGRWSLGYAISAWGSECKFLLLLLCQVHVNSKSTSTARGGGEYCFSPPSAAGAASFVPSSCKSKDLSLARRCCMLS